MEDFTFLTAGKWIRASGRAVARVSNDQKKVRGKGGKERPVLRSSSCSLRLGLRPFAQVIRLGQADRRSLVLVDVEVSAGAEADRAGGGDDVGREDEAGRAVVLAAGGDRGAEVGCRPGHPSTW